MAEHYDNGLTDAEKEAIYHRWQSARDEASYGDLMDWVEKAVIDKALARPASTQQVPMDEALMQKELSKLFREAMDWGRSYGTHPNLSEIDCDDVSTGYADKAITTLRQRLKIGGAG